MIIIYQCPVCEQQEEINTNGTKPFGLPKCSIHGTMSIKAEIWQPVQKETYSADQVGE